MAIKFEPGQVYDVAHLRPFDLDMALEGHPLATHDGGGVRLFRETSADGLAWDQWSRYLNAWVCEFEPNEFAEGMLCLAPLAVKDGRPLHVGDQIVELLRHRWVATVATLGVLDDLTQWSWPEAPEKQGL